jgi:hypothetical protein
MRRFIRYTSLIGAVLGLGVGVMSNRYDVQYAGPIGNSGGTLLWAVSQDRVAIGYFAQRKMREWTQLPRLTPSLADEPWFVYDTAPPVVVFPAILPFVLFTLIFAATFIRRRKPGHCRCGYSLEGLVSEKCPECGRECEVVA